MAAFPYIIMQKEQGNGHEAGGILHETVWCSSFRRMIDFTEYGKSGQENPEEAREQAAYVQAGTVETTGAGDAFCACILNYVLEHGWRECSKQELHEMLQFANAAASIITTKKGALRVMPGRSQVEAFIAQMQ